MRENEREAMERLVKETLPRMRGKPGAELRRDLWPAMLRRLEARRDVVPWFDWALLAAVAAMFVLSPGVIPVLFYYL
jgi:hypothetical protein